MHPESEALLLNVVDAVGGLIEFWGFKRNMGRMWAVLYLIKSPMSAAELSERLAMSTGGVSMTLAELQKWGVVKKAWVPGERRDYYEAEPSIWKMVSRVLRERELRQIHAAIEVFEEAAESLAASDSDAAPEANERRLLALERVATLLELARAGSTMLEAVLAGESIDATPLKTLDK